jgi:putative ABC transport system substrate-binding protein
VSARLSLLAALGTALALAAPAAGRPAPVRVAAFLWHDSPNDLAALAGFRAGLRTARLDWVVEEHQAGGDAARADALLRAIVAERPTLLLALGTRAAQLARAAAPAQIVVFAAVTNPVETGLVPAWEGSGRPMAGQSNWLPATELAAEFRAAVPRLRTLGAIRDPRNPVARAEVLEAVEVLGQGEPRIGVRVEDVLRPEGLALAAQRLCAAGIDALWVPIDHLVYSHLDVVRAVTDAAHVPIVTSAAPAARAGAVLGVVPDYHVCGLQAAELARRIVVEGADPAVLPVGRLRTWRTVVNLPAAARCGHRVPLAVLAGADEVIR